MDIYASNTEFNLASMFGTSMTPVGSVSYDPNTLTQTYTFTDNYSYVGFRTRDGAIYFDSVAFVW